MKIRQVLAAQIKDRMAKRPDLDTQAKLAKAAHVTQSTIWRVLEEKVGASVDVVEALAKAFGVMPITLLSDQQESRFLEAWSKLDDDERYKVVVFMEVTAQARASTIQNAPLSWTSEKQIPQSMVAASHRASARRPGTTPEEQNDRQENPTTPKRRNS